MTPKLTGILVMVLTFAIGCSNVTDDSDEFERFDVKKGIELAGKDDDHPQTLIAISVQDNAVQFGQGLRITVENTGTETAKFLNVTVDRFINGAWGNARSDVECPPDDLGKKAFTSLKAEEKRAYTWDLRADDSAVVDTGAFRISIRVSPANQDDASARFWAHSRPFRLEKVL